MFIAVSIDDALIGALREAEKKLAPYTFQYFSKLEMLVDAATEHETSLVVVQLPSANSDANSFIAQYKRPGLIQAFFQILVLVDSRDAQVLSQAIDAGADDYLVLPLRKNELILRMQMLLRKNKHKLPTPALIQCDAFSFDPLTLLVRGPAGDVTLKPKEFEMALLLMQNLGRPLSRAYLQDALWPGEADSLSRTLDTHISRVRNKLNLKPAIGFELSPIYGYGYLLEKK